MMSKKKGTKKEDKKKEVQEEEEKPMELTETTGGSSKIYGRVSKFIIKQHISKRYKKKIADRIMRILEEEMGANGTFDTKVFLDTLYKILIEKYSGPIKGPYGRAYDVPGIFRFCFDVFDLSDKGFMCEHDLI